MRTATTSFSVLILLATACASSDPDDDDGCLGGKCDSPGDGLECDDPQYGDGTCQTTLACDEPDIDCFLTFENDAAAATWFAMFEEKVAAEESRPPRSSIPESDPRFQKARALVDRGWVGYRENRPVGDLAAFRPALVVIEDPTINAFVVPDVATDRSGFAVIVQTGLLEAGVADEGMLGVMMHELQHAVGLHGIGHVRDELRTFYLAPEGSEPIGTEQIADPRAEAAGVAWRALASEAGALDDERLGGLTFGGQLDLVFFSVIAAAQASGGDACASAIERVSQVRNDVIASLDPFTGAPTVDESMPPRVTEALAGLRDDCLGDFDKTFFEVVAEIAGTTPAEIEAGMSPDDRALVAGKHVVDAIAALTTHHRARMRAIESDFAAQTYRSWSALRFFSFEEDADDVSVLVLRGAGIEPTGLAGFFLSALAPEGCQAALARGEVPAYGVDLADEHHAICWRAYHVHAYADHTGSPAAATALERPRLRRPVPAPRPRLLPERLSDRILY